MLPVVFSPRLYQDAMHAFDACSCSIRESMPPCQGTACVLSLPARRQSCRHADLPHPAACTPEWRQGEKHACWRTSKQCRSRGDDDTDSAGPTKQEPLGLMLALETCQRRDKCRSAISKPYSPAVSRERAFPLPSCAGVEVNFQCSGSTNKLMFNIIITSSSRGSF